MPDLDLLVGISNVSGDVLEQRLILGIHQAKQLSWLGIVVVIILAVIPVGSCSLLFKRRLGEFRLLLPLAIAVGLIAKGATMISINPHRPVAVIDIHRASGQFDQDQMVVYSQTVALGIAVGEQTTLPWICRIIPYSEAAAEDRADLEQNSLHEAGVHLRDCCRAVSRITHETSGRGFRCSSIKRRPK
jgi:hypothetical protein